MSFVGLDSTPTRVLVLATALASIVSLACEDNCGMRPCPQAPVFEIDSLEVWRPECGPFVIDQDVHISTTGRLTILPGTTVEFVKGSVPTGRGMDRDPQIYVLGEIIWRGTSQKPIRFQYSDDRQRAGDVYIQHKGRPANESVIEWCTMSLVEWHGGSPRVRHCHITNLRFGSPSDAHIESNDIGRLHIGRGTGIVSDNILEGRLDLYGGSIEVRRNILRKIPGDSWGAISTRAGNTSSFIENVIEDCDLGMLVFAATPELHRNNFEGNGVNLTLLPGWNEPESDTLDARNNWWGTADEQEVGSSIRRRRNGDTVSQKVVTYVPIALEPFVFENLE